MKCSSLVMLLCTIPTLLISAEPSAFGAGDLNSPNPYGLTSNEKVILETKKTLNKVTVKSNNQANELDSLRERIDGLQGIIESLSRKAHNNKINLQKLSEENSKSTLTKDEYEKRLGDVVQSNSSAIETMKSTLNEVSNLVDKINAKYVSKDEFNNLVNDVNAFKNLVAKELKGTSKSSAKNTTTKSDDALSSADLSDRAQVNFDKKLYTAAIEDYEALIKSNYKPAYAHYMIGEMNFRRKNYSDAISYFKKSSSLYSEATYMPSLMLHTAKSMDNTGDKANAKAFYKAIVSKYPASKEAKEAKKSLE